jgi:diguanylate cyclase (GGDEF)-like protein
LCEIAERIAGAVSDSAIACPNAAVAVTVSVGAARSDGDMSLIETLALADHALYQTKRSGRNSWSMHEHLVPAIATGT